MSATELHTTTPALPSLLAFGVALATLLLPLALGADDEAWKAPARAARRKNPVPADAKSLATGKAAYVKECLSCHGASGKGDGPQAKDLVRNPGDLSNPKMWEQTDGELFWKITEGKKPMPSEEKLLTEEQRWSVVNYLRTLAPRPASGTSNPASAPATK